MYEKLITKMKLHFGDESLIMYSKSCDYYQINPINDDDIKMYYKYLISNEVPNTKNVINDMACCLYYLSKYDEEYQKKFCNLVISKIDLNDLINDQHLILIYNIIEFEDQYLKSKKEKLEYLLEYLERFSAYPKNRTNYLLYEYYIGILQLNIGNTTEAKNKYLEFIPKYFEEIIDNNKENKYTLYIQLRNDLLNIRIIKINQGDDYNQTKIFLNELYERIKNENQALAVEIGFELYETYLKQNRYMDCIHLLTNMKATLKKKLLTGTRMDNAIDFYLAIVSRIGYIGTLINDKPSIETSIKKISKSLAMMNNYSEIDKEKNKTFVTAYSLILAILKINNRENKDDPKKIAADFQSYFLPDLKQASRKKFNNKFIVNKSNFFDFVINFDIINNMELEVDEFWKKNIYEPLDQIVTGSNPLEHKYVIPFILSVHNKINHLTELYCTEGNKQTYKKKIIELAEKVIAYLTNYGQDEILFQTQFLKGIIINIISSYGHIYLDSKEYNNLKTVIMLIDNLDKIYKFTEKTPSYELIFKLKGDYWLFGNLKNYDASINYYGKALKLFPEKHPKRPIIYFNLGYAYYLRDDKKMALTQLNKCVIEFLSLDKNKCPFDFYFRESIMEKKINIAKKIINYLSDN